MWLNAESENDIEEISNLSDEEVLSSSIKNPDLFEILVKKYTAPFLRKAKYMLHVQQDAEDVVQETFVKIYMHADKFKKQEGASFSSWGYKILINNCLTHSVKMKKNRDRFTDIDPEFEGLLSDGDNKFEKYVTKEYVLALLSKIPNSFADILDKYYIQGIPQKELAEKENISLSAIKTRVHRAKRALKNIYNTKQK